jgi:uncharacterized RDD family membrane protein YckC
MKYKTNLTKRIFATLIDYGLYVAFFFMYIEYFGHENSSGGKSVEGFASLPPDLFWFIYFPLVENAFGTTLGGLIFNLRVLTVDRREIGFMEAIKRHLCDLPDLFFFGIPAIIAIKNTEKHQRLGDLWAETIVVDLKDPEQAMQVSGQ